MPAGEPDAERIVDRAASVLGLSAPGPAEETFWAVRRVLEALARERPVLLVLDDVHWGQPTFHELIEHLARWTRDAPVLVVVLGRPELRDLRPGLTDPDAPGIAAVVALEPLREDDSRALIDGLLGASDLPLELSSRILAATDGNPLFLGEVLRMLTDEGVLRRDGERWVATGEADTVAVPPTIQALLAARIERLGDDERTVVERAAVIGHEFYRGAVAELVPAAVAPGVDLTLATLSRKELVRPESQLWLDERVFRFGHILVRDAAYRSLLKTARADLHERFAAWLEAKVGDLVGEHEEVIAFHLEQAHAHRLALGPLDDDGRALAARAGSRLRSAGDRALRREDLPAAINLLERALVPLAPATPERMEALVLLAESLLTAGETGRALAVIEELGEGAHTLADERLGAWATVFVAQLDALTGAAPLGDVIEAATEAAVVLERDGDRTGVGKAFQVVAVGEGQLGHVGAAEAALDRALAAARGIGDDRRETAVLAGAPRAALWGPAPILRAAGRCMDTIRILRMTPGRRHVEAMALRCQAVLEAMRGRGEAARGILADCRAVYEELGLVLELHETAVYAGMAELLLDDPAEAEVDLFGAREGFGALGADVPAALASALLAHALLAQDRIDEALEATRYAEARAGEDLKAAVTWRAARAEALARRGEHEAAREHAERAVALSAPTDALPDKADALMSAARVAEARGDRAAASAAAHEAAGLYEAKGHTVGATRAAAFLDVATPDAPAESDPASGVAARLREAAVGRVLLDFIAAYNARDWERVAELNDSGLRSVDHRTLAWEPIDGPAGWTETLRAFVAASPDSRLSVDRVLELHEDVAAVWIGGRGSTTDGGAVELVLGQVIGQSDGRTVLLELFEPEDGAGMRARVAELRGEDVEARMATTAAGRSLLAFCDAYNARDWERMRASYHEDAIGIDRRALGWREFRGPEGSAQIMSSFAEAMPDSTLRVARVVAMEEEAIAVELLGRGVDRAGGETELRIGHVSELRDGRRARVEFFDPDDDDAMRARVAELAAESSVEDQLATTSIGRAYLRYADANRGADLDALRDVYTPDFTMRDRRAIGWEDVQGLDAMLGLLASFWQDLPERTSGVTRILRMEDELAAVVLNASGVNRDGAAAQLEFGQVAVARDGRLAAIELFEPEDEAGMLARFEELRVADRLAETAIGRAYLRYSKATARGDLDAFREVYAEDIKMRDGRTIGWEDVEGRAAMIELMRGFVDTTAERSSEVTRILALDDEVAAVVLSGTGVSHDGGAAELRFGQVARARDGRTVVLEMFEPDDEEGMLARFEELRAEARLATTPIGRNYLAFLDDFTRRDWTAMRRLYRDDAIGIDHRNMGWSTVQGPDAFIDLLRGFVDVTPDGLQRVERILAMDDDLVALEIHGTGSTGDGGAAEFRVGHVTRLADGLRARVEFFDPDDDAGMLARFAELREQRAVEDRLAATSIGRAYLRYSAMFETMDLATLRDVYTEDFVMRDGRSIGWEDTRGIEKMHALLKSFFELGPRSSSRVERILGLEDELAAVVLGGRGTMRDGGEVELRFGQVTRAREGRLAVIELFDPEDEAGMLARFEELRSDPATGLESTAIGRNYLAFIDGVNARDWDALTALYHADAVGIDHRNLAWEIPPGPGALVELLRSIVGVAPDSRMTIARVLAIDEELIALEIAGAGRTPDGGEVEFNVGHVAAVADGLRSRVEFFDPDDDEGMLARFEELRTGDDIEARLAASEIGRAYLRYCEIYNTRDWDAMGDAFAEDFVNVDARRLGWPDTRGADGMAELMASFVAMGPDSKIRVERIIRLEEDRAAVVFVGRESAGAYGESELRFGHVARTRGGRFVVTELVDPDDEAGIVARFEARDPTPSPEIRTRLEATAVGRTVLAFDRGFAARDWDAVLARYEPDAVGIDRRTMSWREMRGAEAIVANVRSFTELSADCVSRVHRLVALSDDVIAYEQIGLGTVEGGPVEIHLGHVVSTRDGLCATVDFFEPDDDAGHARPLRGAASAGPGGLRALRCRLRRPRLGRAGRAPRRRVRAARSPHRRLGHGSRVAGRRRHPARFRGARARRTHRRGAGPRRRGRSGRAGPSRVGHEHRRRAGRARGRPRDPRPGRAQRGDRRLRPRRRRRHARPLRRAARRRRARRVRGLARRDQRPRLGPGARALRPDGPVRRPAQPGLAGDGRRRGGHGDDARGRGGRCRRTRGHRAARELHVRGLLRGGVHPLLLGHDAGRRDLRDLRRGGLHPVRRPARLRRVPRARRPGRARGASARARPGWPDGGLGRRGQRARLGRRRRPLRARRAGRRPPGGGLERDGGAGRDRRHAALGVRPDPRRAGRARGRGLRAGPGRRGRRRHAPALPGRRRGRRGVRGRRRVRRDRPGRRHRRRRVRRSRRSRGDRGAGPRGSPGNSLARTTKPRSKPRRRRDTTPWPPKSPSPALPGRSATRCSSASPPASCSARTSPSS